MSIHRKHLTHIASLILFIALNTLVYAQPGGGPGGGGFGGPPPGGRPGRPPSGSDRERMRKQWQAARAAE